MAGEVEADIWERVASDMVIAQEHSSDGGGLVRAFISDLGRVVDGRKVGWTCCSRVTRSCDARHFQEVMPNLV